jgi:two-component system sensor histidine kinase UhpB
MKTYLVGRSPYADIVIADPSVAEQHAEIVVTDDGRGFATEQWGEVRPGPESFGLLGMRERIAFLGGVIKVQSKPGAGTTVRIVVPRDRLR